MLSSTGGVRMKCLVTSGWVSRMTSGSQNNLCQLMLRGPFLEQRRNKTKEKSANRIHQKNPLLNNITLSRKHGETLIRKQGNCK